MNWIAFVIAAWVALGLDVGLSGALSPLSGEIRPSFAIPLIVFVALQAPARSALWAALLLGLVVDLINPLPRVGGGLVTIVGPNAIGFLVGAQFVLAMRGMVIHRNPLTMTILSIFAAAIASVIVVAFFTVRDFYPGQTVDWRATHELLVRLGSAAYTGFSGFALSLPLFGLAGLFGFSHAGFGGPGGSRFSWSYGRAR